MTWAALGIAPTADADAVRRAYRARLKAGGPERDPEGFQDLRAAYEAALAWIDAGAPAAAGDEAPDAGDRARMPAGGAGSVAGHGAGTGAPETEAGAEVAAALVARLAAHRAAGDEAGAVATVDECVAAHPPGSSVLEAVEDALLEEVALSRSLSPGLFRHLVARFDWLDAQGRAARDDPERHAIIADRAAAEDWVDGLGRDAQGGDAIAAAMLPSAARPAGPWGAQAAQAAGSPLGSLDAAGRRRVRELFEELGAHAPFVLHRLDAAGLARLREAVEGPPLLGTTPAAGTGSAHAAPGRTRAFGFGVQVGIAATVLVAAAVATVFGWRQYAAPRLPPAPPALTRAELDRPETPWLLLRPEPGGTLVDLAPLVANRRGIADVRYGINVEEPNQVMPLPENGAPVRFMASAGLSLITLRLRYPDGTWSAVRRYPIPKGTQ